MGDSGLAIVDADYFLYDLGKISMAAMFLQGGVVTAAYGRNAQAGHL